jgi:hypothetical protein
LPGAPFDPEWRYQDSGTALAFSSSASPRLRVLVFTGFFSNRLDITREKAGKKEDAEARRRGEKHVSCQTSGVRRIGFVL